MKLKVGAGVVLAPLLIITSASRLRELSTKHANSPRQVSSTLPRWMELKSSENADEMFTKGPKP